MPGVVAKLSRRDLRAHLGRYVLTFLAVAIGVGFVSGVITLTDTISRTFDDLFAGYSAGTDVAVRGEGQFELDAAFGGGVARPRIDATIADDVSGLPGVEAAEGYVQGYTRPISADGEPFGNPNFGQPTIGTNWGEVDALNPFELADGRQPRGPTEVAFDRRTAEGTGYALGDTVTFQTQSGVHEATLVGIVTFGTADSPAGTSITLFDALTAQAFLSGPGQVDLIAVEAADGVTQAELRDTVTAALDGVGVDVVTGETLVAENQAAARETFTGIRTFLLVFALISVLVGSFVIYTSFSFIVAQRQRQVALLRALGAGRGQIVGAVVVESLLVGVLASLVGYAGGVSLAAGLAGTFVPGAEAVIQPRSLVIALTVGTVVTLASAVFPAARASRIPPVAAMRDVAIDTSHRSLGRVLLAAALGIAGGVTLAAGTAGRELAGQSALRVSGVGMLGVFLALIVAAPVAARPAALVLGRWLPVVRGIVGRLAQQNAARNPKRTASTGSALMIGLGIVSLFLVVNASLRASLDDTVDNQFRGDVVIDSGGTFVSGGLPGDIADEVNRLPSVDAATGIRFGFAEIGGSPHGMRAIDPDTGFDLFDIEVSAGDVAGLDEDGIAVFAGIAEEKGWEVGDQVPVVFGETGDIPFTVAALLARRDLTGPYVMGTDAFDANLPDVGDAQIWIRLADGVTVAEARPELEGVIASFPSAEVQDLEEFKAAMKGQYDIILILVNALLALTIVIAMIGIVNALVLSVVERTREIGLTRAVGATRGQVRSSIRWEALVISAFGLVGALGVGVFFGWVLVRALSEQGFRVFALPAPQLAMFAGVTAVLTLVASVLPAAWAGRRRILSAIADQ
jgi:putative ABC transport system permease protein